MNKYIAIDVETPNWANDRICALGISIIEDAVITENKYYLINPESSFSKKNIDIHSIKESDVVGAPTFPEVWEEIQELFKDCIVVAHNAAFDLSVFSKVFRHYGIKAEPVEYVCTLKIAQESISVESFSLEAVCRKYGILFDPHHAMSDANACAKLVCILLNNGFDIKRYLRIYRFDQPIKKNYTDSPGSYFQAKHNEATKALLGLKSFIEWIMSDEVLTEEEISFLSSWMDDHKELSGQYPYDRVFEALAVVLEDGVIEEQELRELESLFKQLLNPVDECSCKSDICLNGKLFVLSGEFDYGSKDDVGNFLSEHGAIVKNSVSKKTDYVLVGNKGNDAWLAGNYGTKIKKAMELQDSGVDIKIIKEIDFFS